MKDKYVVKYKKDSDDTIATAIVADIVKQKKQERGNSISFKSSIPDEPILTVPIPRLVSVAPVEFPEEEKTKKQQLEDLLSERQTAVQDVKTTQDNLIGWVERFLKTPNDRDSKNAIVGQMELYQKRHAAVKDFGDVEGLIQDLRPSGTYRRPVNHPQLPSI